MEVFADSSRVLVVVAASRVPKFKLGLTGVFSARYAELNQETDMDFTAKWTKSEGEGVSPPFANCDRKPFLA